MPTIYRVIYVPTRKSVYQVKRRLADRLYTQVIKKERNNQCAKCKNFYDPKSKGLHISHHFSRAREQTRFDRRNTDLLMALINCTDQC